MAAYPRRSAPRREPYWIAPADPPEPTPLNLPFQSAGIQTSKPISELTTSLMLPTTLQNSDRSVNGGVAPDGSNDPAGTLSALVIVVFARWRYSNAAHGIARQPRLLSCLSSASADADISAVEMAIAPRVSLTASSTGMATSQRPRDGQLSYTGAIQPPVVLLTDYRRPMPHGARRTTKKAEIKKVLPRKLKMVR